MPETIVVHKGHGLPYSKGLMAQTISATGLAPERAFELARKIEKRLDATALLAVFVVPDRKVLAVFATPGGDAKGVVQELYLVKLP